MNPSQTQANYAILPDRAVLTVLGADAATFLQGLVSNDVTQVGPGQAVYAALLTAQGKFLHDFFVVAWPGGLALEAEAARLDDLARRLKLYKLRAKIDIARLEGHVVAAVFGDGAVAAAGAGGTAYADPRLAEAGFRLILPEVTAQDVLAGFGPATPADYDRHRLALGLPDGSRDIEIEKSVLLECGFDELHGVDFQKGCYMGQELTARTKYRGLVKKRLLPVAIEGAPPPPGTPVTLDGRDAGEMRSGLDGAGIALIRLEAFNRARVEGRPLMAGDVALAAWAPSWMVLPEANEPST